MGLSENELFSLLPEGLGKGVLYELASRQLWGANAEKAAILAIRRSNLFDEDAYLAHNPDVRQAGHDPIEHFVTHGLKEKRVFALTGGETHNIPQDAPVSAPCVHENEAIRKLLEDNRLLTEQTLALQLELEKACQKIRAMELERSKG